jgi:catechol 2,3-dioxygenase-like lactoylglutathione lyase family enzyme
MPSKSGPGPQKRPELYFFATTIVVADRRRSVDWYTGKVGFEVIQDLGHWVTVGHRGVNGLLHLCQGSEIGEELSPGNQGITFHVRGDFAKHCEALAKRGVRFDAPPTKRPWGMYARIADPDGNVITLNPED